MRETISAGAGRLVDAGPAPPALAGAALLLAQAAAALAWRSALRACGAAVTLRAACGCYGAGSLANSLLPAGAGDVLRIELFARASDRDSRWLCGGVCAGLTAARGIVFSALLAGGVAAGLLPAIVLLAPLAGGAVLVAAWLASRRGIGRRLGQLARGASALTPAVVGWLAVVLALRVGAAVELLHAFGAGGLLGDAVVLLAALGAAGALPLTPGNLGVASAAAAVALSHVGVDPAAAAAVGLGYHSLETCAGLGFGAIGAALQAAWRQPADSTAAVASSAG